MACTAAIETEIDRHYDQQLQELGDEDPELTDAIRDFQAEEVEHRNTALASGAESAPAYPLLFGLIRLGCRTAIALSKRICRPPDGGGRPDRKSGVEGKRV